MAVAQAKGQLRGRFTPPVRLVTVGTMNRRSRAVPHERGGWAGQTEPAGLLRPGAVAGPEMPPQQDCW
jgi:hypothetical protein